MSINFEFQLDIRSFHETALWLLKKSPNVTSPKISDVEGAKEFLRKRLKRVFELSPSKSADFDCLCIYRGYWAHLQLTRDVQFDEEDLLSKLSPSISVRTRGLDIPDGHGFTINVQSDDSTTVLVSVKFLVDLSAKFLPIERNDSL